MIIGAVGEVSTHLSTLKACLTRTLHSGSSATPSPSSSSALSVHSGSHLASPTCLSTTLPEPSLPKNTQLEQQTLSSTQALVSYIYHQKISDAKLTDFLRTGFFQVWMGFLCFIYMICALRTNIVFVGIFLFLVPAFGCLAGAYWNLALGKVSTAMTLLKAGGACCFVVCALGWWIFFAILLASLDFPFQLPGKPILTRACLSSRCY